MELHLEAKVIGKGKKGRTACGSAAYRACDKIRDNAGNVHDYTHKSGHVAGGIELPEGASEDLRNRQTLWSRHELRDKRKDAELFREVLVALPNDLDYIASARVIKGLAKLLTEKGMCVQWDVHDITNEGQRNLHCHMMITMRELMPDGTFGNKNRSWNHYNGGLNIADLLRPEAACLMNIELEVIGSADRVEHRSYVDRCIDKIPTKHVGVAATAMARKGIPTQKVYKNTYIKFLNEIHAKNLREVESQAESGRLEDLIAQASAQQGDGEVFKDWGALFALLRDTRRSRAAMNTELGKICKIISAYEEGNEEYLRWAGVDPEDDLQKREIYAMKEDLRIGVCEMDVTEAYLLESKEIFRLHNKVAYTSKKASWERYLREREKREEKRSRRYLSYLESFADHIGESLTLLDVLTFSQDFRDWISMRRELRNQREAAWEQRQLKAEERRERRAVEKELKERRKLLSGER